MTLHETTSRFTPTDSQGRELYPPIYPNIRQVVADAKAVLVFKSKLAEARDSGEAWPFPGWTFSDEEILADRPDLVALKAGVKNRFLLPIPSIVLQILIEAHKPKKV